MLLKSKLNYLLCLTKYFFVNKQLFLECRNFLNTQTFQSLPEAEREKEEAKLKNQKLRYDFLKTLFLAVFNTKYRIQMLKLIKLQIEFKKYFK